MFITLVAGPVALPGVIIANSGLDMITARDHFELPGDFAYKWASANLNAPVIDYVRDESCSIRWLLRNERAERIHEDPEFGGLYDQAIEIRDALDAPCVSWDDVVEDGLEAEILELTDEGVAEQIVWRRNAERVTIGDRIAFEDYVALEDHWDY